MFLKTSTLNAPWTIVEANDKAFARVKVLQTLVDLLDKGLHKPVQESDKKPRKHK
jgi:AMP-polyphosphate phosphotransferase